MIKTSKEQVTPEYSLEFVEKKPERLHKRKSKYLPMVNNFLEKTAGKEGAIMKLATVGKDANYMRTQIKKIIINDDLPIEVGVVGDELFLERVSPPVVKKVK